jgi:hypothetical protein
MLIAGARPGVAAAVRSKSGYVGLAPPSCVSLELRIATFPVITDLVYGLISCALRILCAAPARQGGMPLRRPMLTHGRREGALSIVRADNRILWPHARSAIQALASAVIVRLPAGPRQIIERCHRTIGQRPLNTALSRLMVYPNGTPCREKRRFFPISQQYPRPARRFQARAANRLQRRHILIASTIRRNGSEVRPSR